MNKFYIFLLQSKLLLLLFEIPIYSNQILLNAFYSYFFKSFMISLKNVIFYIKKFQVLIKIVPVGCFRKPLVKLVVNQKLPAVFNFTDKNIR